MSDLKRRNTRVVIICSSVVAGMIALSFAAVPLYDLFCRVTGFGGTTQVAEAVPDQVSDRVITVRLNADTDQRLAWDFKPEQRELKLNLGQSGLVYYNAKNLGARPLAGVATYNVTPAKAGRYFNKVQCFCFEEQVLVPGESVDMPVFFFVDPAMADDRGMDDVSTITLSYTFFPARDGSVERALETAYNAE